MQGEQQEQLKKKNKNTKIKIQIQTQKPHPEKGSQRLFRMGYLVGPPAHQSGKARLRLANSHPLLIDKFLIGISLFSIRVFPISYYSVCLSCILPIFASYQFQTRIYWPEYTQRLSFFFRNYRFRANFGGSPWLD